MPLVFTRYLVDNKQRLAVHRPQEAPADDDDMDDMFDDDEEEEAPKPAEKSRADKMAEAKAAKDAKKKIDK